jgi:peptidoglycan/xylan/chitin deacetylase (PgdA/CDA1 family)
VSTSSAHALLAPELALVLSFHGVVERIEHPGIQVNHLELASFERIVEHVRTSYTVVTLDDIAAALRGDVRLPTSAAALTFDDGYRSVLELADPLLSRHGLPYAVFVPSGLVDAGTRVPTYVMRAALEFTDEPSVILPGRRRPLKLGTPDERHQAAAYAASELRSLPGAAAEQVLARLRALLPEERWAELDRTYASEALMGWPELRGLAARGVAIGSHTRDHAVLHGSQTLAEINAQVVGSKAAIEERLAVDCRHFCYPHGSPQDLSRAAVEAVRAAGYSSAFMNVGGPVREGMDSSLLPRIAMTGPPPEAGLAARALLSHSKWYVEVAEELGCG